MNQADSQLKQKIEYAKKFASETIIGRESLAYTTEKSILEQEAEQADKIDAEWQKD